MSETPEWWKTSEHVPDYAKIIASWGPLLQLPIAKNIHQKFLDMVMATVTPWTYSAVIMAKRRCCSSTADGGKSLWIKVASAILHEGSTVTVSQ